MTDTRTDREAAQAQFFADRPRTLVDLVDAYADQVASSDAGSVARALHLRAEVVRRLDDLRVVGGVDTYSVAVRKSVVRILDGAA